jgi:hypothetical protein
MNLNQINYLSKRSTFKGLTRKLSKLLCRSCKIFKTHKLESTFILFPIVQPTEEIKELSMLIDTNVKKLEKLFLIESKKYVLENDLKTKDEDLMEIIDLNDKLLDDDGNRLRDKIIEQENHYLEMKKVNLEEDKFNIFLKIKQDEFIKTLNKSNNELNSLNKEINNLKDKLQNAKMTLLIQLDEYKKMEVLFNHNINKKIHKDEDYDRNCDLTDEEVWKIAKSKCIKIPNVSVKIQEKLTSDSISLNTKYATYGDDIITLNGEMIYIPDYIKITSVIFQLLIKKEFDDAITLVNDLLSSVSLSYHTKLMSLVVEYYHKIR